MLEGIVRDGRYALRLIRLNPGFAAAALFSIALGAGANTAFFRLIDAIRLRPLPVEAPERLVEVRLADMTHARGYWMRPNALTNPIWEQIRQHQGAFSGLFAWADEPIDISLDGESRRVAGLWVSGDFFRMLGIGPAAGRLIESADDYRGCGIGAGVVISDGFRQRHFGESVPVVGRHVAVNGRPVPILGITPAGFSGLEVGRAFDIAMPLCASAAWHDSNARLDSGNFWWLTVMGRLKPGLTIEQASAVVDANAPAIFQASLPAGYPAASVKPYLQMKLLTLSAERGISRAREQYATSLTVLFITAGFVLLVACVNLAHLMLARDVARRRDTVVRLALGASRLDLARQSLIESLLIASIGTAGGVVISQALTGVIVSFLATESATVSLDLPMDARVLLFACALAAGICAVMAGVAIGRLGLTAQPLNLSSGTRSTAGPRAARLRRALLASQIALSLALLSGTLLFARSLRNLQTADAGFTVSGIVIADLNFSALRLSADSAVHFRNELLDRIRAVPSVGAASEVMVVPLTNGNWTGKAWVDGSRPEDARAVFRNMIGVDYFRVLGTDLLAGRTFESRDMTPSSPRVAIVSEAFARAIGLRDTRLLGHQLWMEQSAFEPRTSYEIVGIARDTRYRGVRDAFAPVAYMPLSQAALRRPIGQVMIRVGGPADRVVSSIRTSIQDVNPAIRTSFRSLETIASDALVRERLLAIVSGPFGVLALVLTALGLYGVIAHTVGQRTREIGIRIALGANGRTVIQAIVLESAGVVSVGIAAGVLLTFVVSRAAAALLFGVGAFDAVSVTFAAGMLLIVAGVASYLPARRASRVNPIAALRAE